MTTPRSDSEAYSWLRQTLEPEYQVVADPEPGYRTHLSYCYRVLRHGSTVKEFRGCFSSLERGELVREVVEFVTQLRAAAVYPWREGDLAVSSITPPSGNPMQGILAARLPPVVNTRTWFNSGRAAFAFLIRDVIRPRRVWLPSFICWSLVDVMKERFPSIEMKYYRVRRDLSCDFPAELAGDDALVAIHYFGCTTVIPRYSKGVVLEDVSHCLLNDGPQSGDFRFGSLRKVLMLADGGFVDGSWNPVYEAANPEIRWLRTAARDWRDLREAENMLDRCFEIGDMSSQSLATLFDSDPAEIAIHRRRVNLFLEQHLHVGQPLVNFGPDDVPMLHCRQFDSSDERDEVRRKLSEINVFCSVHWPTHDDVRQNASQEAFEDASWLEQHTLCIPVLESTGNLRLEEICARCSRVSPRRDG